MTNNNKTQQHEQTTTTKPINNNNPTITTNNTINPEKKKKTEIQLYKNIKHKLTIKRPIFIGKFPKPFSSLLLSKDPYFSKLFFHVSLNFLIGLNPFHVLCIRIHQDIKISKMNNHGTSSSRCKIIFFPFQSKSQNHNHKF